VKTTEENDDGLDGTGKWVLREEERTTLAAMFSQG